MESDYLDQRRFQRIFFTIQTGPRVHFITSGSPTHEFVAEVVNLCEGGIGLAAEHSIAPLLSGEDQQLQIQAIEGDVDLCFLVGEKTEVRWILDTPQTPYCGFGCQFISISDTARLQLQKIVSAAMQEHQRSSID